MRKEGETQGVHSQMALNPMGGLVKSEAFLLHWVLFKP